MRTGLSSRLGGLAFLAMLIGMETIGGAKTPYEDVEDVEKARVKKRKPTLHTFTRSMGRVSYRIT